MYVPGHTPACVAYQFGDAVFVGDTLFMPDVGTARCDFPGGDAQNPVRIHAQNSEPAAETRLFMCHDYPPHGRPVNFETTVAEQKAKNIHVHDGISEAPVCRNAHPARCHAGNAGAHPACGADQHPCWRVATQGRQRHCLRQNSFERAVKGNTEDEQGLAAKYTFPCISTLELNGKRGVR
jgi:hypothetical protein